MTAKSALAEIKPLVGRVKRSACLMIQWYAITSILRYMSQSARLIVHLEANAKAVNVSAHLILS